MTNIEIRDLVEGLFGDEDRGLKLAQLTRHQVVRVAKALGCYTNVSRLVKANLIEHVCEFIEAELEKLEVSGVQSLEDREIEPVDYSKFDGIELVGEFYVSVGEDGGPERSHERPGPAPRNLPTELGDLYLGATDEEKVIFSQMLERMEILSEKKKRKEQRQSIFQDKRVASLARKKAGCTRLDAAIFWLFHERKPGGYSTDYLADRWMYLSGEPEKEYQLKMFEWYLEDFKRGSHNRESLRGQRVLFKTQKLFGVEFYSVDLENTKKSSLSAYVGQAEKLRRMMIKTPSLSGLYVQAVPNLPIAI